MLATLQRQLCLRLASCALQSQHDLLRCLRLLVENGFCLTTITGLLAIITTLSLREQGRLRDILLGGFLGGTYRATYLSGLVLCDFMLGVLSAVLALAVGASGLGYVDLWEFSSASALFRSKFHIHQFQHAPDRPCFRRSAASNQSFQMPKSNFAMEGGSKVDTGVVDRSLKFVVGVAFSQRASSFLKRPPSS
jgi:hypothetical protein